MRTLGVLALPIFLNRFLSKLHLSLGLGSIPTHTTTTSQSILNWKMRYFFQPLKWSKKTPSHTYVYQDQRKNRDIWEKWSACLDLTPRGIYAIVTGWRLDFWARGDPNINLHFPVLLEVEGGSKWSRLKKPTGLRKRVHASSCAFAGRRSTKKHTPHFPWIFRQKNCEACWCAWSVNDTGDGRNLAPNGMCKTL